MLRIVGAGFGRTGTLSMKSALETLGFGPCYHMFEVFGHPEHVPVLGRAAAGETIDWENIFAEYSATVDWPTCAFYRELTAAYPDAPVLLTVRDPERWFESFTATIRRGFPPYDDTETVDPQMAAWRDIVAGLILDRDLRCDLDDRDAMIATFVRHNDEVRATVPAERLVEYEVGQGWEPLCAALGVPVPEEPFPHLNERSNWAT